MAEDGKMPNDYVLGDSGDHVDLIRRIAIQYDSWFCLLRIPEQTSVDLWRDWV